MPPVRIAALRTAAPALQLLLATVRAQTRYAVSGRRPVKLVVSCHFRFEGADVDVDVVIAYCTFGFFKASLLVTALTEML